VPDPAWPIPEGWQLWLPDEGEATGAAVPQYRPGPAIGASGQVAAAGRHAGWILPAAVIAVVVALVGAGAGAWLLLGSEGGAADSSGSGVFAVPGEAIAFDPADGTLAVAGDGEVNFYDPGTGEMVHPAIPLSGGVSEIGFSPDGDVLAVLCDCEGDYGRVTLWDPGTGASLGELISGDNDYTVAFDRTGDLIATGTAPGDVVVGRTSTGRQVGSTLTGHRGNVLAVAFNPAADRLATAGTDDYLLVWDTTTFRQVRRLEHGHTGNVNAIAFSPDGAVMATGDFDGALRLWEAASGRLLGELGFPDAVFGITFAPDGKSLIATGYFEGAVVVRDTADGPVVEGRLAEGPAGQVDVAAYSPDGSTVATASDGLVTLTPFPENNR